jgi:hypothetical protein
VPVAGIEKGHMIRTLKDKDSERDDHGRVSPSGI